MPCGQCGGRGHVCIDDICQSGECIHGDSVCPTCGGDPDYGEEEDDEDYETWRQSEDEDDDA